MFLAKRHKSLVLTVKDSIEIRMAKNLWAINDSCVMLGEFHFNSNIRFFNGEYLGYNPVKSQNLWRGENTPPAPRVPTGLPRRRNIIIKIRQKCPRGRGDSNKVIELNPPLHSTKYRSFLCVLLTKNLTIISKLLQNLKLTPF